MTIADIERQIPDKAIGAVRNTYIFAALAGIVLGIILLVWPAATIDVAGILLGLGLIASGLFRLYESFAATFLSGGYRFALALLGLLIIWAGGVVLFSPDNRVWFLAVFIGIGWIFQGFGYFFGPTTGSRHASKIWAIISGLISIAAGIIMLVWPALGLATFVWVAGILLIVVSVASLFSLPKKV